MKTTFIFAFIFLVTASLTAQIALDSIVIVDKELFNSEASSCEQLNSKMTDLAKAFRDNHYHAMLEAAEMSREVTPCYYYKVEVKITRMLDVQSTLKEKGCTSNYITHSTYAHDYTFYLVKTKANVLYTQPNSGRIICDYEIENLPDYR